MENGVICILKYLKSKRKQLNVTYILEYTTAHFLKQHILMKTHSVLNSSMITKILVTACAYLSNIEISIYLP